MNLIRWSSDDTWFCSKPKVFPQYGTTATRWNNIRHVRIKRQLSFDVGSEYKLRRNNKYSQDFDPYKYVERSYGHYDPYYGHSSSGYGSGSGYGGYGHESYGHEHHDCCPLVVDPMTLCALLGLIAAATYFLRTAITMNMNIVGRKRRKKRSFGEDAIFYSSSHKLFESVNNSRNDLYFNAPSKESDELVTHFSMSYLSKIFYQGKYVFIN